MVIQNVQNDSAYRKLTEDLLRTACDSIDVEVTAITFGERDRDGAYSWICFVANPEAEDRVAPLTGSSAADHFALVNPNGFSAREAGSRLRLSVFKIEVSDQAPIMLRGDDGEPTQYSPWIADLVVVRAKFNYQADYDGDA